MEKKRVLTTLGAVALTAALTITGTFALMNKVTETKTNTFTSSKDIETRLDEDFDETTAGNYTPGQVIHKEPVMRNEGTEATGGPIYVGVKLEFIDNKGTKISKAEFEAKYAEMGTVNDEKEFVEGLDSNWKSLGALDDGSEIYMYNSVVPVGQASTPIFTHTKVLVGIEEVVKTKYSSTTLYEKNEAGEFVEIEKTESSNSSKVLYVSDADGNKRVVDAYELPKFEIKVTGYAVQGDDNISVEEATNALKELAGKN